MGTLTPLREFEQQKRDILDRVDIVDLVSAHVSLKRAGRRFVGLCPFHSEKTPSFTVSPELGIFKCFGCGKGGDVFSFIQHRENVSFSEAMSMLADRAGVTLERASATGTKGPTRADLAKACGWAAKYFRGLLCDDATGRSARAYLDERGFSAETLERFGVGLAIDQSSALASQGAKAGYSTDVLVQADLLRNSDDGRVYDTFRSRIIFPIRDPMQRVIGFGGRTLIDDRAKYLNTRQNALFDKGRSLFGIDLARAAISERGRAVVVEGYTDCLAMHQCGFTETVATLGTALTEAHVDVLRRYADEIILLFDSDEAGEAAAERAIGVALPRCVRVRLARITDGKDPAELLSQSDPSAFTDVLNGAVDALEFKWLGVKERFGANGSDTGRREAVVDFVRVVGEAFDQEAVDVVQRGLLVNQVAHLLGMNRSEVDALMRRTRRRAPQRSAASGGTGGERTGVWGAEQLAWTRILEVAFTEPRLLIEAKERIGFDSIASPVDQRIARAIVEATESGQAFRVVDVIARCEEGDTERIAALVQAGSVRGRCAETFASAVELLTRARHERELDHTSRVAATADPDQSDAREAMGRLHEALKGRGFGTPRRLSRRVQAVGGPETETP